MSEDNVRAAERDQLAADGTPSCTDADETLTALMRELDSASDLSSVRPVAIRALTMSPTPGRLATRRRLAVALRVTQLLCQGIDELLERCADGPVGVNMDLGVYRPCRGTPAVSADLSSEAGMTGTQELITMADHVETYLENLNEFDDYAGVVAGLVTVSTLRDDSDDLVIHRCLLATHALAEVFIRAVQSGLPSAGGTAGAHPARYPKGDVKDAVLRTASGPVLGHHQIIILNSCICSDPEMPSDVAFASYRENLCWMADWATADRGDADIRDEIDALVPVSSTVASGSSLDSWVVTGRCKCRKLRPRRSSGAVVLVENAVESIMSTDVKVLECVWFGDG